MANLLAPIETVVTTLSDASYSPWNPNDPSQGARTLRPILPDLFAPPAFPTPTSAIAFCLLRATSAGSQRECVGWSRLAEALIHFQNPDFTSGVTVGHAVAQLLEDKAATHLSRMVRSGGRGLPEIWRSYYLA